MSKQSAAVGFAAGATIASFAHREALGRQFVHYGRSALCYRRPSAGGIGAIGDSITLGDSRPDWGLLGARSWLAHALVAGRLPYCWNAAFANQTTEWVGARIKDDLLSRQPEVAVILTGTNDVLQQLPLRRAVGLIEKMIQETRESGAVPVVGTLPPIAETRALQAFNEEIRNLEAQALIIDFYRSVADNEGRYRRGMSFDGLHPARAGAEAMGRAAVPVLRRALESRS